MPPVSATTTTAERTPMLAGRRGIGESILVKLFVVLPLLALVVAVPFAWGWGLGWLDVGLTVFFYYATGLGVTVGFHRYFTHRAFTANRGLRVGLAIAGSMSFQGPVITWVADHRRHHAYADKEGDPHSPWLYGTSVAAVAKGFAHAHVGWLFERDQTNAARFAPDLLADDDLRRVDRLFMLWSTVSLLAPAVIGGLVTWSWWGALTALFWAGFVRIGLLHHVTWSINSICHMIGERPFAARDRSTNFWPLAVASMGESWHNLHHADPTCARHGVLPGQIDMSARLIWIFEKLGWASRVRWPTPRRLDQLSRR
ncbi:acyl-CoA desaturase [Pseudonocardia acaciae]|uniref:acyl-CoA desaturase n=1 Tax=Pseudonocardia acaciae TaxID=551276 RepID=UPI00048D4B6F|nr:acyl-CoA desaturase [Pseudonocardia acaciae]